MGTFLFETRIFSVHEFSALLATRAHFNVASLSESEKLAAHLRVNVSPGKQIRAVAKRLLQATCRRRHSRIAA